MAHRLRIARVGLGRYRPLAAVAPDGERHRALDGLIRRHLPAVTASLLAQPSASAEGGFVDWYTDLAGQPVALAGLSGQAGAEARARLADRLDSLKALADRLEASDPAAAGLLRAALSFPGEETVYVVGGQPVITFWGHQSLTAPPLTAPPAAAPPATAGSAAGAPPPPAAAAAAGSEGGRRGLWLGLLALLLVAGLGWLTFGGLRWPPWGPDFAALLAAAKEEEAALLGRLSEGEAALEERLAVCAAEQALLAAQGEEERLQALLAATHSRLAEVLALCPLKQQLGQLAEQGRELQQRLDQATARLTDTLSECRRKQEEEQRKIAEAEEKKAAALRRAEAKQRKAQERPPPSDREVRKAPPKAGAGELPPCPGERPPELAPDVAIVLDASGSMGWSASASTAEIQKQLRSLGGLLGLGAMIFSQVSGPTRLDEAKKGVSSVVRSLPSDVDVGLVTLQQCPRATRHGFFSGAERGALHGKVAALRPMQGTPLAQGLIEAAQMVDGVNAEAVLVVISDGEDSCGQDPCATARRLKASKPQLKINVVDIVGDGAANCLAIATGGRILQPEDGLSFERMIKRAAEEALKPPHCP